MTNFEEFKEITIEFSLPNLTGDRVKLLGENSTFVGLFEHEFSVLIEENASNLSISGYVPDVKDTIKVLLEMNRLISVDSKTEFNEEMIINAINITKHGGSLLFKDLQGKAIYKNPITGQRVYAKSPKQREYINSIYNSDVIFGVGEAGTAKTYLSIIAALNMLHKGSVEHIVITRPAVDASKHSIGMLPGSLYEKMQVYLSQILADIQELTSKESFENAIYHERIEVLNVGLARGRSFKNSIVIIDESQNLDYKEFELLLTRIGEGSKMVFIGDNYQSDIHNSAFDKVEHMIKDVDGVSITKFGVEDIVRSEMASKMVKVFKEDRK